MRSNLPLASTPNLLPGEVCVTRTLPRAEPTAAHPRRPFFAHALRILALPIILLWIVFAVLVNVIAPQLEVVGEMHSAPMAPEDAPSMVAMKRMGANFQEFNSNSTVMIILDQVSAAHNNRLRPRLSRIPGPDRAVAE